MTKQNKIFDWRFRSKWLNYVAQSSMAVIAVLLVFIALRQQHLVVVASLAATGFTIFTMPNNVTASSRNVLGGHMIGMFFGSLFSFFSMESGIGQDVIYALAVGFSMFAMTITNTEHPPAAGTALGVVLDGFSQDVIMGITVGAGILTAIHWLLKPYLLDLIAENNRNN